MKLAVSNIAWTTEEAPAAYQLLADLGINGIEVAPGVLFPTRSDPLKAEPAEIEAALMQARFFGHRFVSMQSIHFGMSGAALFGGDEERARFITGVHDAVSLAAALSIGNIVLGSPRNRVRPPELDVNAAFELAARVLLHLAEHASAHDVTIALEANPERYGTNFMTHFDDARDLCAQIGHPAIGVNYDLGERIVNGGGSDIATEIRRAVAAIRHVQISAPDLLPPIEHPKPVRDLVAALDAVCFSGWTSIEMRRPADPLGTIAAVIEMLRSSDSITA